MQLVIHVVQRKEIIYTDGRTDVAYNCAIGSFFFEKKEKLLKFMHLLVTLVDIT